MPIEPIPDLLAELRAGRYPHDFVEALAGDDPDRSRVVRRILADAANPGDAITNLMIIGARNILSSLVWGDNTASKATARAIQRLNDMTEEQLADYAGNPGSLTWND